MSEEKKNEKIGVVLFNLGGPDSLDAIQPFLYNLFQDPDILKFPLSGLVRKPLAWIISKIRASKTVGYYEAMGGKSPLKELTLQQSQALEALLNKDLPAKVVVAMRYWVPTTDEAIQELVQSNIKKIVLLPLYPQYSYTTTRSSFWHWQKKSRELKAHFKSEGVITTYYNHPLYLQAMAERIVEGLLLFPEDVRDRVHLLFSAHGIPLREIREGDPYEHQIQESVKGILAKLNCPNPSDLAYQSRVGPMKWLEPSTPSMIEKLAKEGVKHVLAIPVSFVSDHSETLYELKKQYGEMARNLGITQYELMPALNCSDSFIGCLKELVLQAIRDEEEHGFTTSRSD